MSQAPYRDDLASVAARADRLAEENAELRRCLEQQSAAARKQRAAKVMKLARMGLPALLLVAMAMTLQAMFLHSNVHGSFTTRSDSCNHTRMSLFGLHSAAEAYRLDHPEECPLPEKLHTAHLIPGATPLRDAWGTPYAISCTEAETMASSAGADRRFGTSDDIVIPTQGFYDRLSD